MNNNKDEDFLLDDEYFFNDTLVFKDEQSALVTKDEKVISWEITGLYSDSGVKFSSIRLKRMPPVLKITNNNNEIIEIVLTKNLAKTLSDATKNVHDAYYNIDSDLKKISFREKIVNLYSSIMNHKMIFGAIVIFVVLAIISMLIN